MGFGGSIFGGNKGIKKQTSAIKSMANSLSAYTAQPPVTTTVDMTKVDAPKEAEMPDVFESEMNLKRRKKGVQSTFTTAIDEGTGA